MKSPPEDIDLSELAETLRRTFGEQPPIGYLPGRTAFRDAIVSHVGCSQLEAEQLVDTMVTRGFLRYQGNPTSEIDEHDPWSITRRPA
jgi:hypothetical protein